jgi:AraC-like DNA-binding protein
VPELDARAASHGSVSVVLPLLEYLESAGLDPDDLLARVGIARSALADPRSRLPKRRFQALWRAASQALDDPAIALRVATMVRPSTLGVIGHLGSASPSVRDAFETVQRLTPLLWEDFECGLETRGEVAFLRCGAARPGSTPEDRFTSEYAVALAVAMSRWRASGSMGPLEARFSYPAPPYAEEYGRILQLPVRFDAGEDGILLPVAMIDVANPAADARLIELLERYAAEQLAGIATPTRFGDRVRACIRAAQPAGSLTATQVAERLSVSTRTLRRRLSEEGSSYREIVDEVRADLARHHLAREKRDIDDVAFLLGFSDQSAFTKAFRRWTGRTPADYARRR